MRRRMMAAPLAALALASCLTGEPNVYALPSDQVLDRLAQVQVEPSGQGPFGRLDFSASRLPPDRVVWSASGAHAVRRCELTVTPVDEGSSRVDVTCGGGGPSSGLATRMENNLTRKAVIELIDSTLEGRPYDPRLARGATAAGWPKGPPKTAS